MKPQLRFSVAALATAFLGHGTTWAAEDFRVRYNLVGTIGGEIFAPEPSPGWTGAFALTYLDNKKITGDDGNDLTVTAPGGKVPLPAPAPAALYPSYGPNKVTLTSNSSATIGTLALARISDETYAGGRLVFLAVLPMATNKTSLSSTATTPTLNWPNAAAPAAPVKSGVQSNFGAGYQANIAAQTEARNGEVTGFGDLELSAGWIHVDGPWKVRTGASLIFPTGKYSASAGPDIGNGNFYTFRPELQATYMATPKVALSAKAVLGFNTSNNDNQLRSGDWYGLEGAVGYMSPIGPVGLQAVYVNQYQDDENNVYGASRFQVTGLGGFFTTRIDAIGASLNLQQMVTIDSKNARHSNYTQLRLIKQF